MDKVGQPMKVELQDWTHMEVAVPKLCNTEDASVNVAMKAVAKLVKVQNGDIFVAACEAEPKGPAIQDAPPLEHPPGLLQNRGSLGHPEMCQRPCVYISAYGTPCPHGDACGYCHFTHTERRTTLDKRQREFLRALKEQQLISVLLPHFQAKLTSGKVPSAAADVVEYLQRRAKSHVGSAAGNSIRPEVPESLDAVLGQMSFSWLVSLFPFKKDPSFVETLDRLLLAYAAGRTSL
ncbi:unnamed protein product [Cladocopium goreaui]|uniref:C3H1-type domain-containing protein n=1 Tax=Cladocopium goreaui TaxID=2562237 RepID=A0A9P1GFC9_9DINO|nr:unnamed protein product [Cladocopium goreaui]